MRLPRRRRPKSTSSFDPGVYVGKYHQKKYAAPWAEPEPAVVLFGCVGCWLSCKCPKSARLGCWRIIVLLSNSVTFVVPPRPVNPGGAVLPYGGPKQPNEDPSAKGLLPGRDCQQGTRGSAVFVCTRKLGPKNRIVPKNNVPVFPSQES